MEEEQNVEEAFGLSDEERKTLGTELLGEFLGRTTHGESWMAIVADLESRHPDLDVKELIAGVSDINLLPWKHLH